MSQPLKLLTEYSSMYPGIWNLADELRSGLITGEWPEWRDQTALQINWDSWSEHCFLPLLGWFSVLCKHLNVRYLIPPHLHHLSVVAFLGAWRPSQDICRFEPGLYEAMRSAPLEDRLPSDMLQRLPSWCVYVETPSLTFQGNPVEGFLAMLDDTLCGTFDLQVLIASPTNLLLAAFPLGPWSMGEALMKGVRNLKNKDSTLPEPEQELLDGVRPIINMLLYLCGKNTDVATSDGSPLNLRPAPQKIDGRWQTVPPVQPRIIRLG